MTNRLLQQDSRANRNTSGIQSDKYDVEWTTYPDDLFTAGPEKYGKCWVMININASEDSLQTTSRGERFVPNVDDLRNQNTVSNQRFEQVGGVGVQVATGALTGAAAGAAGATLAGVLNGGSGTVQGVARGAGAGLAVGVAAGAAALLGTSRRKVKRVRTAIQLPMPNSLNAGYQMDWGEDNTALFDMIMRGAEIPGLASGAVEAISRGDMTPLADASQPVKELIASKILAANSIAGNRGISAMLGITSNPKKEVIFNGVDFRNFSMSYRLFPKTEQEMLTIDSIIRILKFHMHPEYLSESRWTFLYPSEFDITFYTGDGKENTFVTKIATCVLKNMTVNYTPDGLWSNHREGAPTGIELSLNFQELSILTKKDIAEGF